MQASSSELSFPDEEHRRWRDATRALAHQDSVLRALVLTVFLGVGAMFALAVMRMTDRVPLAEWSIASAGAMLGLGCMMTQLLIRRRVAPVARSDGWSLFSSVLFLLSALAAATFAFLTTGAAHSVLSSGVLDALLRPVSLAGAHLFFLGAMMASLATPAGLAVRIGADGAKRHVKGANILFVVAFVFAAAAYALHFAGTGGRDATRIAGLLSALAALIAVARSLGVSRHLDRSIDVADEDSDAVRRVT